MDRSAEGEGPVTVVVADSAESGQPIRRMVRRRLVQSTLFPQKSPQVVKSGGDKKKREDEECNGEHKDVDDRDEEENCRNSQGSKRKVARKAKASNSHSRTPKKSKGRSSADSTPKKNETINVSGLPEDKDVTPPSMPNVRLEAKMADEEYSQKYSGKQLHPFFSLWKGSKRHQAIGDVLRGSDQATAPPIHVFERDEDDAASLDWRNWEFHEKSVVDSASTVQNFFTIRFEASTELLFSRSPFVPCMDMACRSVADNNVYLDQHLPQGELLTEESAIASTVSSDVHEACCQLKTDMETDCKPDEYGRFGAQVMGESIEKPGVLHHERVIPHCLDGESQVDNRLWTDKYQPKMAREVCSNIEAVNFVNEWLHSWHQKGDGASKVYANEIDVDEQDTDYFCSQSDSETISEMGSCKPVLLITGPTGSGKSAAIYACAKEQGYKILEVSTSECRNGAGVKRRFGEALESQFFKRSVESPVKPQGHFMKLTFTSPDYEVMQEHENKVIIDLESKADKHNTVGLTETCGKFDQATKTLILFEDVDVVFPEDAGFISAIQHIADNAKGPVILTSNSDSPVLPDKLDRLHVNFKMPTGKDLLQHVYKVCSSEKADSERHLIDQIVECCHGDIRKAIMHAQFWCQVKQLRKTGTPILRGPLNFYPEAAHQLLPKMIPWDCPSQLSELIEKEITRSLLQSEETYLAVRTKEEKPEAMHGDLVTCGFRKESTEAKKEAMLGRHCLEYDCNNFTTLSAAHDGFVTSTSPVSFARRNSRRKLDHVVSSDSEDDTGNFLKLGEIPSDDMSLQINLNRQADFQSSYRTEELNKSYNQYSETAVDLDSNHICQSIDISCVPESSFVPETKIDDDTRVSVDQVTSTLEEVSVTNGFDLNLSPVEENLDECTSESYRISDSLGSCNQLLSTLAHQEIEDSQTDFIGVVAREYQVMDECSRIDFNKKCPVAAAELGCLNAVDMVQETWRKLRHHHSDLRHLVASEDENASGIVRLASGMSNLVSEAEILLSKCHLPGSSELFISLSEVSDPFSWLDEQRDMASNIVQHGFGCYVGDINGLRSKMGSQDKVNLTWEMWSTGNMVEAESSLMSQDPSERMTSHSEPDRTGSLSEVGGLEMSRENQSHIYDLVHSIVPLRSHSTVKGESFQDYLSALSHISRSEASRLLEQGNCVTRRRRTRASQHYLSGGSFSLSADQISLLDKCNTYKRASGENCTDTS